MFLDILLNITLYIYIYIQWDVRGKFNDDKFLSIILIFFAEIFNLLSLEFNLFKLRLIKSITLQHFKQCYLIFAPEIQSENYRQQKDFLSVYFGT